MYYILFYKTIENYIEKRVPFRESHLAYASAAHKRGELVFAGALAEPADSAVLVFKVDKPSTVEKFAKHDPYVLNGLITEWKIRPWSVVIGG
ncbi:MAG: YciI-like protein [Bacteroidetes bacterium]|nr:YciI-like protein [Bacteroidota bacterium]